VVSASLPYDYALDILVHELAHVAAPVRSRNHDGHTREWERAYRRITRAVFKEVGIPCPKFHANLRQRMGKGAAAGQPIAHSSFPACLPRRARRNLSTTLAPARHPASSGRL
jgi:hypothetical protein